MPVWKVSEPYISLWLHDEPLGYQPAVGPRVSFELAFKQREAVAGFNTNTFNVGRRWNCQWLSCVTRDTNANNVVNFPGGGQQTFYNTNDYLTGTSLTGDTTNGFILSYPDGSRDVYGFMVTNSSGIFQEAFLTQRINPQAQRITLNYSGYASSASPVIRLQYVVDGDGRTSQIYYNSTNVYSTNLISQVTDAFGRSAYLSYNTNGNLTNIIDVAGNSTLINYDTNNWVTSMTTPYGTTSIGIVDPGIISVVPNGRSILVNQPDGGHQLFLYQDSALGSVSSYATNQVPVTTPLANTLGNTNMDILNTFHWGSRQYAALSTTDISSFTASDFLKARMQHWLKTASGDLTSQTLSMEREPSPDIAGTIEGQKTWYDYAGKIDVGAEGSQVMPSLVGRGLPDGTTAFVRNDRNSLGFITTNISTYTSGGNVALRTNLYVYGTNNIDLVMVTNALGLRVSSNVFNAFHQVTTNFDALNQKTVFAYNTNHQLLTVTLPTGLATTNIYGLSNLLTSSIVIGFATNSFTYTNDLVLTHAAPRGLSTTNSWDNLNRLTGVAFPNGSSIANVYTILDLTATRDRLGNWTHFGYDNMRRNTTITNALGNVTTFTYCTCGALDSALDAANNLTQFYYDNQGNLTNTVYADTYSVTRAYDLLRRVVKSADSGGNSITNTYNNQGIVIAVSNAFGQVQGTVYDILDRATNNVDANGVSLNTTYDNLNRPLNRSYPDDGVEHWGYTLNVTGATSYTNQISNITLYGYDAMSRKTNEVSVGVTTNSFAYDGAGDLLTLTDGKNQVTAWGYDSFGRVTNKLDAANNLLFLYKYDPDNRLTNRTSVAKGSTTYKYDAVGNLTNIVYPVSSPINLKYDALNRLTNMVDAVGTNVYGYDQVGQLVSEGGLWNNDTVSYGYNNRLRTSLSLQAPNSSAWVENYSYDTARRLTSLASPAGTFNYAYDPVQLQRVDELTLPNGADITNNYDNVARLLSTKLMNSSAAVLDSEAYAYNQGNQRTGVTRTAGDYVNYTYDNIGELKTALGKEAGGVTNRWQEQFGYAYDAAGNLNLRTNNALVQTFNVNNLNELTTITNVGKLTVAGTTTSPATNVTVNTSNAVLYADTAFASTNQPWVNGNNTYTAIAKDSYGRQDTNSITVNLLATNSFAYDLNGNLLTNGTEVLVYNDENELVTNFVAGSWKSEFMYDGRLRRRIQRDYSWNGSAWIQTNETRYIYDGNVIVQHRDGNNLPTLTLTRGNDLSGSLQGAGGIGGLLAMTENYAVNPVHSYYHADGNGNVTMLINANQLQVGKAEYDPFGVFLSLSGSKAEVNAYWFSSKPIHWQSGKYDYLYRWYAPQLDRWLNRDPLGERGGINLYDYVANDPINLIDPLGLYGNPVSGPSGPVGPTSPYSSGGGNYANGYLAPTYTAPPLFNSSFSFGLLVSGNAESGLDNGSAGNYNMGFGLFYNPQNGFSLGGFQGGGTFLGGPTASLNAPQSPTCKSSSAWGAGGGAGVGPWISNAGSPADLGGPFDQSNFNTELFGGSYANSGGTWILSGTIGPEGSASGASLSTYPTTTWSAGGFNLMTGQPISY